MSAALRGESEDDSVEDRAPVIDLEAEISDAIADSLDKATDDDPFASLEGAGVFDLEALEEEMSEAIRDTAEPEEEVSEETEEEEPEAAKEDLDSWFVQEDDTGEGIAPFDTDEDDPTKITFEDLLAEAEQREKNRTDDISFVDSTPTGEPAIDEVSDEIELAGQDFTGFEPPEKEETSPLKEWFDKRNQEMEAETEIELADERAGRGVSGEELSVVAEIDSELQSLLEDIQTTDEDAIAGMTEDIGPPDIPIMPEEGPKFEVEPTETSESKGEIKLSGTLATFTLAEVYLDQGQYEEAIRVVNLLEEKGSDQARIDALREEIEKRQSEEGDD